MFKLVIEDDDGNKTVVPVIRDEITIGRKDGNTIRLTERNVSRDHARLVRENGGVVLEDVSARYGTRKNGEKIDRRADFSVGDVFTIGDYRLTLQSDVAAETKPPKKPNGASPPPLKPEFSNQPTQLTRLKDIEGAGSDSTAVIEAEPARLVIVSSNFAGQEFPLARDEMVIGRGEECDIIIDHRSVSQSHAKVVLEEGGEYKIVDLKSKNGVKVGGEEYRAVHLKRGDIVELGHVKFRFVEAGENYVFTPQIDEEVSVGTSKKGLWIALAGVLILVSVATGYIALKEPPPSEPIAHNTIAVPDKPTPEPPKPDGSALDAKIDKAEQDYMDGQVERSLGALEFLRDEKLSSEQVARLDDLFSKARREKGLALHLQNGKAHFEGERWMEALAEFHEIPNDDALNVYRLVQADELIDKAVIAAVEEQLERAEDADKRGSARDTLTELAALYPTHVTPTEALAEIDAMKTAKRVPIKKTPRNDNNNTERPKPSKKDPELAAALHKEAMGALVRGDSTTALSKSREAIANGCTGKCYRAMGMAYHKRGETSNACRWFKKSGGALPGDLQCP